MNGCAGGTIRPLAAYAGMEAVEARFHHHRFSPHRHETYVVGRTTKGVQRFRYRGEDCHCRCGDVFVLHPDELHDGWPGTVDGYGYHAVYLSPTLVADALDGAPLPFVADGVSRHPALVSAVAALFADPAETSDGLGRVTAVAALADALAALTPDRARRGRRIDVATLNRVRDHLMSNAPGRPSVSEIERQHGIDRFTLARGFRRRFGVSPRRFVTHRRLEIARRLIRDGVPLAEAAVAAGFADQSHLTRQFRRAFGISPGRWRSMLRPAVSAPSSGR